VNQVFEIMVKWVETKDWEQALYAVVPKRKFQHADKGSIAEELVVAELEDWGEQDGAELVTGESSSSGQLQEETTAGTTTVEAMVDISG
jgi:tRNA (guanine9-N1)-methyltransferase